MNKKAFTEADIRTKFITPALTGGSGEKWNVMTQVPIPPLAEQRRIVAKVDQLLALVDQLESQLADSGTTSANLLEALIAELTPASDIALTPISAARIGGRRYKRTT